MSNFIEDMKASGARYKAGLREATSATNLRRSVDVVSINSKAAITVGMKGKKKKKRGR